MESYNLWPFILTLITGILIFIFREEIKKYNNRKEVEKKLRAKILFWILDSFGDKLEPLFIVGNALSSKYDYISNPDKIEDYKKNIDSEISIRIVPVKESLNKSNIGKELLSFFPKIKADRYNSILEYLVKFETNLKDGIILLDKSDLGKLKVHAQIGYHEFYQQLSMLIISARSLIFTLRHESETSDPKEIDDSIIELLKAGTKSIISMNLLLNQIK